MASSRKNQVQVNHSPARQVFSLNKTKNVFKKTNCITFVGTAYHLKNPELYFLVTKTTNQYATQSQRRRLV